MSCYVDIKIFVMSIFLSHIAYEGIHSNVTWGFTSSVILQIMYWPKNFGNPLRSIKLWHVTQLNIGADDLTLAWPLDTRATLWTLESYINCIHVFIFLGNDTHFEILKSVIVIRFCNIFFIIVNIGWCPVPPNKRIEHKFSEHRTPSLKHMSIYFVKLWMSNCIRKKILNLCCIILRCSLHCLWY